MSNVKEYFSKYFWNVVKVNLKKSNILLIHREYRPYKIKCQIIHFVKLVIVGILGSGVHHLFVFRAYGPIRGREVVWGGEIFIRKDCVSKYRLVLIIMVQESGPRINASSADQCRGPKRLFVVQGDVPRSLVGVDKYCRDIRQGKVLKYLRGKLLPSH